MLSKESLQFLDDLKANISCRFSKCDETTRPFIGNAGSQKLHL